MLKLHSVFFFGQKLNKPKFYVTKKISCKFFIDMNLFYDFPLLINIFAKITPSDNFIVPSYVKVAGHLHANSNRTF